MLKPGWLVSDSTTGLAVSHELPTGTGIPATDKFTMCSVILDVVLTLPVLKSTFPVVGPSLMNRVVAVTGIRPNCLNDPVAGGRDSVAVIFPVPVPLPARTPGPSFSLAGAPATTALPPTLSLPCTPH